ncbi:hypothetical protein TH53_19530 [Pedobacter lusitanus]|uniref:DUF3828 domain-containing protein n=1 Tax=Pedobacter lusitanus TaxID=1503925 RepID=A0A0D0GHR7_9SPHI|nr:hypothetical protein [Pedobacter lusitanus]KIO75675.1 hypothetical protein TH53_19530 [Pedobacter lusitanus]
MFRRKIIALITLGLLCALQVNAQKSCLIIPDSLGKYLVNAFLTQQDLGKASVFSDTAVAPQLINSWNRLLHTAKTENITSSNTSFYNSYFSTNQVFDQSGLPDGMILYAAFQKESDTLAIQFKLLRQENKWQLTAVDDHFFRFRTEESNKITFERAAQKEESGVMNQAGVPFADQTISDDRWKAAGTCVSDPISFITAVLQDIAANKPVKEFPYLLSESDFIQYFRQDLLKMVATKFKGSPGKQEIELLNVFRDLLANHPEQYYNQSVEDIGSASRLLHEFKYTISKNKSVGYHIRNYDNDLYAGGKICLEVTVKYETDEGEKSIQFSCYWIKGRWVLVQLERSFF